MFEYASLRGSLDGMNPQAITEIAEYFKKNMGYDIPPMTPFVGKNFNYPQAAQEAQVDGKVILQFVIEKDGSLSGITVLRDIGHGTGEEAARMLKTSPNWKPGIQNGKPVRVQFTLPIQLNLAVKDNAPEDKPAEPSN